MIGTVRRVVDVEDYYTDHDLKGQIMWIGTGFAFTIGFIRLKNSF